MSDQETRNLRVLVHQTDGTRSFPFPVSGRATVGRSADCDIPITDLSVSRLHAVIERGPPLRVRDAGSRNGVRVRGRRLAPDETVELSPGEPVQVGTVTISVRSEDDEQAPERAAQAPVARGAPRPAASTVVVVNDPAMLELLQFLDRVAAGDINVLLLGETGVGKEVFAEVVHRRSPRAKKPFLRLNCAALSPTLLESEIFGHERGSFTGATHSKPGLLETADGGTVFLDEVGDLPLSVQVKLLRVLEEKMVWRVGGLSARPIDVRFVAATLRDLAVDVARGAFRQDLYFRLNGVAITIPPLRDRRAEIAPLARHFLSRTAGGAPPELSPDALTALLRHPWPGNIRELRNAMERAALLTTTGRIELAHLPKEITHGPAPRVTPSMEFAPVPIVSQPSARGGAPAAPPSSATLQGPPSGASPPPGAGLWSEVEALERQRILDALDQCSGNQTRAARLLGMSRSTLVARLEQYGVPRPRKPQPG